MASAFLRKLAGQAAKRQDEQYGENAYGGTKWTNTSPNNGGGTQRTETQQTERQNAPKQTRASNFLMQKAKEAAARVDAEYGADAYGGTKWTGFDKESGYETWLDDLAVFRQQYLSDYNSLTDGYQRKAAIDNLRNNSGVNAMVLRNQADTYRNYFTDNQAYYDRLYGEGTTAKILESISVNSNALDSILENLNSEYNYWNQWETEDDYNEYMRILNYDLDAGRQELAEIEARLEAADEIRDTADWMEELAPLGDHGIFTIDPYNTHITNQSTADVIADARDNYEELTQRANALRQDIYNAETLQKAQDYASLMQSPDFDTYAKNGVTLDELSGANADHGLFYAIGEMLGGENPYSFLKENELAIYNYLLGKEGEAAAQEYLDFMRETLEARRGASVAERVQGSDNAFDRFLQHAFYSVGGGLNQFATGVEQLFTDERIPGNSIQFANQELAADLNGLGYYAFQAGTSVGNMLPAIVVGALTGGLGASAGVASTVAAGVTGVSSAGNAQNQALAEGYSIEQARSYGFAVGLSEAILQRVLSGVGSFAGLGEEQLLKRVANLDTALARLVGTGAVKFGSEILEEEVQLFLEPYFAEMILGKEYTVPEMTEILETAFVTLLSTGMLEGNSILSAAKQPQTQIDNISTTQEPLALPEYVSPEQRAAQIAAQNAPAATKGGVIYLGEETPAQTETALKTDESATGDIEARATEAAYEAGKANIPRENIMLETPAQEEAYNNGRIEYIKSTAKPTEVAQQNAEAAPSIEQKAPKGATAKVAINTAMVQEAAASLGENGAKALAYVYTPEIAAQYSPTKVAVSFAKIYNATLEGKSIDGDLAAEVKGLPATIRMAAIDSAKNDALIAKQAKYFGEDAKLVKDNNWKMAHLSSKDTRKLDALAKVLGVQIRFAPKVADGAANAQYIRGANGGIIELALDGNDPFMTSAVHEAIHRIREASPELYSELSEFVRHNMGQDSRYMAMGERSLRYQTDNVSDITEEMVADAFGRMMNDSEVLTKLAGEHRTVVQRIMDSIRDMINAVKRALNGQNVELTENQKAEFRDLQDKLTEMEKVFRTALKESEVKAEQRKTTTERDGVLTRTTDADGTTVLTTANDNPVAQMDEDGSALFSLKTYEAFGRAELKRWLDLRVSKNLLSKEDAADIVKQLDEYYDLCQQFKNKYAPFGAWSEASVVTDNKGKPVFSVVKANGEYAMNLDFSLVCKKRRTLDAVFGEMIKRNVMDFVALEEADIVKINDIIRENGFETACALCFVDSKRYRQAKVTDNFVNQYNELVRMLLPEDGSAKAHYFDFVETGHYNIKGTGLHTLSNADLAEGIKKLKQVMRENGSKTVAHKIAKHLLNKPSDRKFVSRSDFMNTDGFGAVKLKNPAVMKLYNSSKGSGGPKAAFSDVQYLGEILSKKGFTAQKAYLVGGVRIQSFSDYIPRLVFDYLQMVGDLAAKKLPAHAYTKEATFVKQFGMTGIKMNMSLVPDVSKSGVAPGLDENGDYIWKDGQSFGSDVAIKGSGQTGYELAIEIQNAEGYSKHCGTIAVGVSDEHITKMLGDDNIRMIIPYHKSSLNHIVAMLNNIDQFKNYTGVQNTRDATTRTNIASKLEFNFNEALIRLGDAKAAANEYLAWCREHNYIPKFNDFAYHENYYKLLEDFATYDNGVASPQGAVTMTFPKEGDAFGSMTELIEQGLDEDAVLEGRRDSKLSSIVDQVEAALEKKTDSAVDDLAEHGLTTANAVQDNKKYSLKDSEGNKLTKAQQDFFEKSKARDKDGNLQVYYHGTPSAGFTKFDPSRGRFGGSWFTTSRIDADSYAGNYEHKLFDPEEKDSLRTVESGDYRIGSEMRFDTEEDRAKFIKENPGAEDYRTASELETLMEQASEDGDWDTYDELEDELNGTSRKRIEKAYARYEWEHAQVKSIGEMLDNPEGYTVSDLLRAYDSYDRNNMAFDSVQEGATVEDLIEGLRAQVDEDPDVRKVTFRARVQAGQTGDVIKTVHNRTYAVYLNAERPAEFEGYGRTIMQDNFYRKIEQAMKDDQYDSVIVRNLRTGAHQEIGDVVIVKNEDQVKLITNKNPTPDPDIRYSLKDDKGRELTTEQANYFENSKVRDENGNLKVMYHGTQKYGFTIFGYGRQKFGLFGGGFYFTDDRTVADGYAKDSRGNAKDGSGIYEVYLNITRPIDMDAYANKERWVTAIAETFDETPRDINKRLEDLIASRSETTNGAAESIKNSDMFYIMREVMYDQELPTYDATEMAEACLRSMGYDGITHVGGGRYNFGDKNRHRVYIAFDPEQIKNVRNEKPTDHPDIRYSLKVTDKDTLASLNAQVKRGEYDPVKNPNGGYYVTYKSMSFWGYDENGNAILRSPMAEYVEGKLSDAYLVPKDKRKLNWYEATESIDKNTGFPTGMLVKTKVPQKKNPDKTTNKFLPAAENQHLIRDDWSNLYYNLRKKILKNGKWEWSDVPARYNPYEHSSNLMLNDQFETAYLRDNLVTVKMYVPVSEDKGAYRAQWAKDPTGWGDWKSGVVAGAIGQQKELQRRVYLSRYAAPVEIVSNAEVAQAYKSYLEGTTVAVPDNVVSPDLLNELKKAGVPIKESGKVKNSLKSREQLDEYIKHHGEIPKGEKPTREIHMPTKTKDNRKLSYTVRTVLEAGVTPDIAIPTIEEMAASGEFTHEVYSDKEAMADAKATIKSKGWALALTDWLDGVKRGEVSKQSTALGWTLYNNAVTSGDIETSMTILTAMVGHQRDAAQALQASRILKKLSPEGQLYQVAKSVERLQEEIDKRHGKGKRKGKGKSKGQNSEGRVDPANVPVEEWMQKTGEILADKLAKVTKTPTEKAKTTVDIILDDLWRAAREKVTKPTRQTTKRTNMEVIEDLFNNQEEFQRAWDAAKQTIEEQYGENPEVMAALEEWRESALDYNEMFTKEVAGEFSKRYGVELKVDRDLAEQFLQATTQEERDEILKEIYRDIGSQVPATFMDKWNAWRYLAMLGNFRTHVRNIAGNAGFAPVVAAKDMAATAIEWIVNGVTKGSIQRTKKAGSLTTKRGRDILKAAWADFDKVKESMGDAKYSESINANQYIEEGRRIFKFKPLEKARRANSAALEVEDLWFSRPHYAYAMAQYCLANNITAEQIASGKAILPARTYAMNEAKKATYRDVNAFSQMVSGWGRGDNKNGVKKVGSAIVAGILPFRRTPANILVRGLEYSPAGLLKSLTVDLWKVKNGEKTAAEAIDNISAGLTGTGLVGLGVLLAAEGLLRGHGGDDEDENKFEELMGHQAYALELPGGKSVTLDWLAPEVLPLFIGVNLWEMAGAEGENVTLSTILGAVSNVTEPLLEMSCLQSLNDVFDSVGYASSEGLDALPAALASAATSYLTQAFPTLMGQGERSAQEDRMTTYTEKNAFLTGDMQYLLGGISAKIPGWDFNQIPYIDAWGRKETNGNTLERIGNNFLNPAYTSDVAMSDMEAELLRLYEQTGEANVFPERADKYFTVSGERIDLTAEQYVKYATVKGQTSHEMITDLVTSKGYKALSDAEKVEAIAEVYGMANEKAKAAVSNYKPTSNKAGIDPSSYAVYKAHEATAREDGKLDQNEVFDIIEMMLGNGLSENDAWELYIDEYTPTSATAESGYNKDGTMNVYGVRDAGVDIETWLEFKDNLNNLEYESGKQGARKAAFEEMLEEMGIDDETYAILFGTEYKTDSGDSGGLFGSGGAFGGGSMFGE